MPTRIVKLDVEKVWSVYRKTRTRDGVWSLRKPVLLTEIRHALINRELYDHEAYGCNRMKSRKAEIGRIAWLIENWTDDPVSVIINTPRRWGLDDGNHRMHAAKFMKRNFIHATIYANSDKMIKKFLNRFQYSPALSLVRRKNRDIVGKHLQANVSKGTLRSRRLSAAR